MRIALVLVVVAALGGALFLLMSDDGARGPEEPVSALRADERGADATPPVAPAPAGGGAEPASLAPAGGPTALPASAPDAGAAPAAAADDERPRTTLTGRVLDAGARPVPGARVAFHDRGAALMARARELGAAGPPPPPETRTDDAGRFELEVPLPREGDGDTTPAAFAGSLAPRLAVVADGYAVLVEECPTPAPDGTDVGDLQLDPGCALFGVVLDPAGRAVADAEVRVRARQGAGGTGSMMLVALGGGSLAARYTEVQTDAAGRFRVEHLGAGAHTLEITAEGMRVGVRDELVTRVGSPLDVGVITLEPGASIAGVVLDSAGAPVEGASVRVSSLARLVISDLDEGPSPQLGREWRLRATTDADGRFRLDGLGPGQYTVHADAAGFAPAERENVATGNLDVRLVLERLGGAFLSLRSARDDAPVEDARFTFRPRPVSPGSGPVRARLITPEVLEGEAALAAAAKPDADPAGAWFLQGVGPDGLLVEVLADGHAAHEVEIPPVHEGGVSEHVVRLPPQSLLAGVVLDGSGEPLADALVRVERWEPPDEEQGAFRTFERDVRLRVGGDDDANDWRRTRTDASGRFRMPGLPAGDWMVRADAPHVAAAEPEIVSLEEGEERLGLVLRCAAAGWIAGVVVERDGAPVAHADVVAKYLDEPPAAGGAGLDALQEQLAAQLAEQLGVGGGDRRSAVADEQGRFELLGLRPGRWEVGLKDEQGLMLGGGAIFVLDDMSGAASDDTAQVVSVAADEESYVEIVRPPRATLEGRVLAAGEPVPGVSVRLASGGSPFALGGQAAETGPDGRFRFEQVQAGDYTLSSIVPGAARRQSVDVQLEAGRSVRQDLVFSGATLRGRVVDAETGAGVAGARITAAPVEPGGSPGIEFGGIRIATSFEVDDGGGGGGGGFDMTMTGGSASMVRTNADGHFEVRFLTPGDWVLESEGGGYAPGEVGPLEVADESVLDDVLIEVQRAASIFGSVTDGATGLPLDRAPVSVRSTAGGSVGNRMEMASGGEYRVEGLEPGEYVVSLLGSGFNAAPLASETVVIEAGEQRRLDLSTEP